MHSISYLKSKCGENKYVSDVWTLWILNIAEEPSRQLFLFYPHLIAKVASLVGIVR